MLHFSSKIYLIQFVVLVEVLITQAYFWDHKHPDVLNYFYGKCASKVISKDRTKCVGYPIGCIDKKTCLWAGAVTDDGKTLTAEVVDYSRNALRSLESPDTWPVQSFDGWGMETLDKTMTKIECREPQIEDYKFFFLFNDTAYFQSTNASSEGFSFSRTDIDKAEHLEECKGKERDIPAPKNPKYKFNLRYFLYNYCHFSFEATKHYQDPFEFADSIDYNIDETKMLFYSGVPHVSSGGVTNSFTAGIFICFVMVQILYPLN